MVDPNVDWLTDPNEVLDPKTEGVVVGVPNKLAPQNKSCQFAQKTETSSLNFEENITLVTIICIKGVNIKMLDTD